MSRKGAKSRTGVAGLRSAGTKVRGGIGRGRDAFAELEEQLEVRTRELAEAREHLAEALERQTATSEVLYHSFGGEVEVSSTPARMRDEPVEEGAAHFELRDHDVLIGLVRLVDEPGPMTTVGMPARANRPASVP